MSVEFWVAAFGGLTVVLGVIGGARVRKWFRKLSYYLDRIFGVPAEGDRPARLGAIDLLEAHDQRLARVEESLNNGLRADVRETRQLAERLAERQDRTEATVHDLADQLRRRAESAETVKVAQLAKALANEGIEMRRGVTYDAEAEEGIGT
jgi:hypothetical protein